ncbi:hypothetical protein [Nocardioides mangrovi]|uniref:Uncharacterized protein n=1 Tax=Nocardioides mangrovi TaxID=2874580 RepID=A0ABS7UGY3_9ACTN|nr:hypothetical protein [Nocardioides mangrovi]MBZ5740304.1 hypothetical protein [Nocardioides mangrovi]
MSDNGFGSGLWKNLQQVRLGEDGGIEAPVRVNGEDGIVIGADAVAAAEARQATEGGGAAPRRGLLRRLLRRG